MAFKKSILAFLYFTHFSLTSLSAPTTVSSQITTRRRSYMKKAKAGDVSHLHRTMPDECSFFCSEAGDKHCSIIITCAAVVPTGGSATGQA